MVRRVGAARAAARRRHRGRTQLAGGEVSARRSRCCSAPAPGCLVGHAGADQLAPRQDRRQRCRRRRSRSSSARSRCVLDQLHRQRRARQRSATSAKCRWWALVGGLLGAVYVTVALRSGTHARRERPDGGRDHRPARDLGRDRPLRPARHRATADRGTARSRARAARRRGRAGGAEVGRLNPAP